MIGTRGMKGPSKLPQRRCRPTIDSVDTVVLGANTYAQSRDYWLYAEEQGEYGGKLNNLTKFVASSKLDDAPWGDFPPATVTGDPAATIGSSRSRAARTSGRGGA
jgi:hypothetical protein